MHSISRWLGGVSLGLFLTVCLILMLQAATSRALSIPERNLPIPELHRVPFELGRWKAPGENALEDSVAAYLKPDEYILRDYVDAGAGTTINVFVAYFKSLQNTYGPHSPRICLPGAGWLVRSSRVASVHISERKQEIPVNEYVLERSGEHILVLYWYQNDRTIWAEEFRAKLTLLPDLLRYRRSDVSLVRLITPLRDATPGKELRDCLAFTNLAFPLLVERFESVR